ncbi:flavodoxin [Candidatus Bathyarchaeota archaeon]|nr:flavodoxin [Candidatus Bathyarchaeota archaeon]
MNALVVYYSLTGVTEGIAKDVASILGCDTEPIRDIKSRSGTKGFIRSGYEAKNRDLPEILEPVHDPRRYDVVVIGTPVWYYTMASPVRTYLERYGGELREAAFIVALGGVGDKSTLRDLEEMTRKPVACLAVRRMETLVGAHRGKLMEFCEKIEESVRHG